MASKVTKDDKKKTEVFDVANWLDRATGKRPATSTEYEPKHRAEGPAH